VNGLRLAALDARVEVNLTRPQIVNARVQIREHLRLGLQAWCGRHTFAHGHVGVCKKAEHGEQRRGVAPAGSEGSFMRSVPRRARGMMLLANTTPTTKKTVDVQEEDHQQHYYHTTTTSPTTTTQCDDWGRAQQQPPQQEEEATPTPTTAVGLRLAALPMDQCAARMLNLARASTAATPPTTTTTTTTSAAAAAAVVVGGFVLPPFPFKPHHKKEQLPSLSSAQQPPPHTTLSLLGRLIIIGERGLRLCAPAACTVLHRVGLTWAPLLLLCIIIPMVVVCGSTNTQPVIVVVVLVVMHMKLTLLGTALSLTHSSSSSFGDMILCAVWTTVGAALVVVMRTTTTTTTSISSSSSSVHAVVGAVAGVAWLLSMKPNHHDYNDNYGEEAVLTALRATIYEGVCLWTVDSPTECWARYGAVLTCASSAPTLVCSLAILGAALSWSMMMLRKASSSSSASTAAISSSSASELMSGVDALDVQEAFRLARAQYYLSGGHHHAPSQQLITEKNA
jgi:hypothetical protein